MKRLLLSILISLMLLSTVFISLGQRVAAAVNNQEEPSPTPEIVVIAVDCTPTPFVELTPGPSIEIKQMEIRDFDLNQVDIEWLARLAFLSPLTETSYKAALMWLVLNRVDSADFPNTVQLVISQGSRNGSGGEFGFWDEDKLIKSENLEENRALARLVLNQWQSEKAGCKAGRPIPKEALFIRFTGESNRNLELLSERGGTALYYPTQGAYEY